MKTVHAALFMALTLGGCLVDSGSDSYEECISDSDCNFLDDVCLPYSSTTVDTAICTTGCIVDADCPTTFEGFSGACLGGVCLESCGTSADCAIGFECEVVSGFGDLICVPR